MITWKKLGKHVLPVYFSVLQLPYIPKTQINPPIDLILKSFLFYLIELILKKMKLEAEASSFL
jgi:hypothetical protein